MTDPNLKSFAEFGLRFPLLPTHDGYLTSGDCRLHYAVFGEGEPVLLLHGGMGNATNWAHQVGFLVDQGYQAVVMDTRAHGRSTAGSQGLSYRVFAQDTARLIGFLQLGEVFVVGWSDGACTALELGRTQPQLLKGILFFACNVDPSGTREFRMTETIQNCLIRHERDFRAQTPTLERFEDLQPKLEPMQKNEPNYSAEDLGGITVPVVVVQGDQDEFIRLDHAEYLARSLGNGRFEPLAGLGHFAPIEDPPSFNSVLLKCLKRVANHPTRPPGAAP